MNKKIKIKTLTPLHIGSGKKLEAFDYLWLGNKFFALNQDAIFNFIFSKSPDIYDDFNQWIDEKTERMSTLGHRTPKSAYNLNPIDFVADKINDNNLKKELFQNFYDNNLIYYGINNAINPNGRDVSTLLKNAKNEVYIPGSSLKGVIRTALLNESIYNLEESDANKVKNILSHSTDRIRQNPSNRDRKQFADEIIRFLVSGDTDRNGRPHRDAKFDIFKFIKISDSLNTYIPEDVCILVDTKLYKLNGQIDPQAPVIEAILPDTEFEFILDIDVEYIKAVAKSINNTWKRYFDVMEFVFGISKDEILNGSTEEIRNIIYEVIKAAVANFSVALLKKSRLIPVTESEYAIKLGWASGFPATTLFDSFTSEDMGMKEVYKNALEKFGIGIKRNNNQNNNNNEIDLNKFPVSQRIELTPNNQKIPLGWIDVIL